MTDTRAPQFATPVYLAGDDFANIAASTSTQIYSGGGVFSGLTVNTAGTTSTAKFYDGGSSVVTMTKATPGVISWAGHGLVAGNAVQFTTTGALYTGLTAGTVYYVSTVGLTDDAFVVADSKSHALAGTNSVATSGSESGVQTAWNLTNPIGTFDTAAIGNLPLGTNGAQTASGLIAITADGGSAADLTVYSRTA